MLPKLRDWAQRQAERSHNRTVGLYLGALGFGYNTEDLKKRKLTPPACWADLIKPEFKGEVQMADPNSSGTAWTMLATIVQLMGEDKAFDYLKQLHRNINEYTKAGAAPALAAGQGETLIGIAFQHDLIDVAEHNKPVAGGVAVRGHRLRDRLDEPDQGRQAHGRGEEVLRLGADAGGAEDRRHDRQLPDSVQPRHAGAAARRRTCRKIKLIEYDFAKYGSSADAQAAARQVDRRGEERAEVGRAHCRTADMLPLPCGRRSTEAAALLIVWLASDAPACWSCRGTGWMTGTSPPGAVRRRPVAAAAGAAAAGRRLGIAAAGTRPRALIAAGCRRPGSGWPSRAC